MRIQSLLPTYDRHCDDLIPHTSRSGVSPATHHVYVSCQDIRLPGAFPLALVRLYSTSRLEHAFGFPRKPGPLGPGWTARWFSSLTRDIDGFTLDLDGHLIPFDDVGGALEREGGALELSAACMRIERRAELLIVTRWQLQRGGVERFHFRPRGHLEPSPLLLYEDQGKRQIQCVYARTGQLEALLQKAEQRRLDLEYQDDGRLYALRVATPGHEAQLAVRYEYDAQGRLSKAIDPAERSHTWTYDDGHRLLEERRPGGACWYYDYDEEGRCTERRGEGGLLRQTVVRDPSARLTTFVDPMEASTLLGRDDFGRVDRIVSSDGTAFRRTFDASGRTHTVFDTQGDAILLAHDEHGHLIRVVPLGLSFTHDLFDGAHQHVHRVDPAGGHTHWTYHPGGDIEALILPSGNQLRIQRSHLGHIAHLQDAAGRSLQLTRDEQGRWLEVLDDDGAWRLELTPHGRASGLFFGSRRLWEVRRDRISRPLELTAEAGERHIFQWDAEKALLCYKDPLGLEWRLRFDAYGLLQESQNPLRYKTRLKYDLRGHLVGITNARGDVSTVLHSPTGRLLEVHFPDGRTQRHVYDAVGRLLTLLRPGGSCIEYRYDKAGHLIERALPMITPHAFVRDSGGRLIEAAAEDITVRLEWDAASRLMAEESQHRRERIRSTFSYNFHNLTSDCRIELPGMPAFQLEHNPSGQLVKVSSRSGDEPASRLETRKLNREETTLERMMGERLRERRRYDALGRLIEQRVELLPTDKTQVNGQQSKPAQAETALLLERRYAWDLNDQLVELQDCRSGSARLAPAVSDGSGPERGGPYTYQETSRFEYNSVGALVGVDRQAGTGDAAARQQRVFDGAGDPIREPFGTVEYLPGSRVGTRANCRYGWNSLGCVDTVESPAGLLKLKFNALYQLEEVKKDDRAPLRLRYDALGRLALLEQADQPALRVLWHGLEPLAAVNAQEQTSWIFEGGELRLVWRRGAWFYVITGHAGEVLLVLSADGVIEYEAVYRPEGGVLARGAFFQPWQLPGHFALPDLPLTITPTGVIDQLSGRWLTPHGTVMTQAINPFVDSEQQKLYKARRGDSLGSVRAFPSLPTLPCGHSAQLQAQLQHERLEPGAIASLLPCSLERARATLAALDALAESDQRIEALLRSPSPELDWIDPFSALEFRS